MASIPAGCKRGFRNRAYGGFDQAARDQFRVDIGGGVVPSANGHLERCAVKSTGMTLTGAWNPKTPNWKSEA